MIKTGDVFVANIPIDICEDCVWQPGTKAEVVKVYEGTPLGYDLQSPDGVVASFAEIDLEGEHAWFRRS